MAPFSCFKIGSNKGEQTTAAPRGRTSTNREQRNVEQTTPQRSPTAGTSRRSDTAGTSGGSNVAGTSGGSNVAGTSGGSNVAGTSGGSIVAGTSGGSNVAGTSGGSNVAGTSGGPSRGGLSRAVAGKKLRAFSYSQLCVATENFSHEHLIGHGDFGSVFQGRLQENGQLVAVKKLNHRGVQCMETELEVLSRCRHANIMILFGYCEEGQQRIFVYDFMRLSSLEHCLHENSDERGLLDWDTRMEIAAGVAEGLDFLHDQPDTSVIFRNLKSSNVLLTLGHEGFLPKLSDFWLAKFGAEPKDDRLHVSTSIAGNSGYWAPEYMAGKISLKTDVYSFGILLLEIVTGRRASKGNDVLVDWLQPRLRGGNIVSIVDETLGGQFPAAMLDKVIQVALACIRRNPDSRPTMKDVTAVMDYVRSVKHNPDEGTSNAAQRRRLMEVVGITSSTTSNRPETGVSVQIVELLNKDKGLGVAEAMKWASRSTERSTSF